MAFEFTRTTPILRIFDETKAREFYIDFLGFNVEFEHRFEENAPLYLGIKRGNLSIHLSEHHGDCCPGARIFVEMTGIEELHAELSEKKYKYNRPGLDTTFYGTKCVEVSDPFGNRISFNEYIK